MKSISSGSLWRPHFEPGQVLTARELNQITAMSAALECFQARQFHGQGILYGLAGRLAVDDRELVIEPGAAIDCVGRQIFVHEPLRLPVCGGWDDSRGGAARHPHVSDPGLHVESFTPVLFSRVRDVTDAVTGARRKEAAFEVRMVSGRVCASVPTAYRAAPLEPLPNLRASDGRRYVAAFEQLKEQLLTEMSRRQLEPFKHDSRRRLKALTLSEQMNYGLPTAADVLAIAALNETVYSLWQRARAQQYLDLRGMSEGADRADHGAASDTVESGVPLGWLFRDGDGAWRWDGRWRAGFALGLSRLSLLGYSPPTIRELAANRVDAMLRSLSGLRPFLPPERSEHARAAERPVVWSLEPKEYEAGTQAWLRELRLDRPLRAAGLWPLDPLRGSRRAPVAPEPRARRFQPGAASGPPTGRADRPAPSTIDPLNDPFAFADYADAGAVDPDQTGLVALAELIGFPVPQVWGALARQPNAAGEYVPLADRPVSIDDDGACEGLEFVLVANYSEPLTIVTEADSDTVLGFARAATREARERRDAALPERQPASFFRWLFRG